VHLFDKYHESGGILPKKYNEETVNKRGINSVKDPMETSYEALGKVTSHLGFEVRVNPLVPTHNVERKQVRFSRSKGKRIRKKWAKNPANFVEKKVEQMVRIGNVLYVSEHVYQQLKGAAEPTESWVDQTQAEDRLVRQGPLPVYPEYSPTETFDEVMNKLIEQRRAFKRQLLAGGESISPRVHLNLLLGTAKEQGLDIPQENTDEV
jgi:hypothetical protein